MLVCRLKLRVRQSWIPIAHFLESASASVLLDELAKNRIESQKVVHSCSQSGVLSHMASVLTGQLLMLFSQAQAVDNGSDTPSPHGLR